MKGPIFPHCLYCLFVRAQEVTNIYCNPQWWVVPDLGFYLKPKNNFTDLLHYPDVVGPWYGGGKVECLIKFSTYPNITYITGKFTISNTHNRFHIVTFGHSKSHALSRQKLQIMMMMFGAPALLPQMLLSQNVFFEAT